MAMNAKVVEQWNAHIEEREAERREAAAAARRCKIKVVQNAG